MEAAFQTLKQAFSSALILPYPQPRERFFIDTYASNVGNGGVISQVQDGQERVIDCYVKTLSKVEINYCVTRRELLVFVTTLEHFHKYL
jgi:hypothetical protein